MKWTETRSVLEDQVVERLPPELEDQQAIHEESLKGQDTWATMTSPPIPISRDERISEPEREQPATPCAHERWLDHRSTSLVKPLQDRKPPPMELFHAQLKYGASLERDADFTSVLSSSWSRSVWWPAFLRHASHLLHREHAIPAVSDGVLGTFSAPRYNTGIFLPYCSAPSVEVSSPPRGGGKRVPFYLIGDVYAY